MRALYERFRHTVAGLLYKAPEYPTCNCAEHEKRMEELRGEIVYLRNRLDEQMNDAATLFAEKTREMKALKAYYDKLLEKKRGKGKVVKDA